MSVVPYAIMLTIFALALVIDLGYLHRKHRAVEFGAALRGAAVWMVLAMLFNVFVFFLYDKGWFGSLTHAHSPGSGREAAMLFLSGYLVELSLSLDNLFVIACIFGFFRIPRHLQHTVLFWGVIGAIVMRMIMISAGVALINAFSWMIYIFGALLFYAAYKLLMTEESDIDPEKNLAVRLARKVYPVTTDISDERFFTVHNGKRLATPMFLALIAVESADLLFAVDSIPAIFSITREPFLVISSNLFAILGLRQMYFALSSMVNKFQHLKVSLAVLLALVGVKMMLSKYIHVSPAVSLVILVLVLGAGILTSIIAEKRIGQRK